MLHDFWIGSDSASEKLLFPLADVGLLGLGQELLRAG